MAIAYTCLMTNEDLIKAAKQGFIPYEGETEDSFRQRSAYSENIKETLQQQTGQSTVCPPAEFKSALDRAFEIYAVYPSWVPVVVSNEKLPFWQGGVALIFQLNQGSPLSALIQLREKVFSFWVDRQELIVHEMAHIARMGFKEKRFEEMLAYSSSKSPFYRYWGPLFRTPFESLFFTSLLILITTLDVALLMSGSLADYDRFFPLKAVPLIYLIYLMARLVRDQRIFKKTVEKVGLPVALSLTDLEIATFSKLSLEEIKSYFEASLGSNLRKRVALLRGIAG